MRILLYNPYILMCINICHNIFIRKYIYIYIFDIHTVKYRTTSLHIYTPTTTHTLSHTHTHSYQRMYTVKDNLVQDETLVSTSGKMMLLDRLLPALLAAGHRVLIC